MKAAMSLLVLATFAFGAQALSLKEKKQMGDWNKEITGEDGYSAKVKANCGTAIPVKLEENVAGPFMAENTSASSYCNSVPSTIATMCEDATSKAEIVKKIKAVTCKLGKEGKLSMSGTTVVFEMKPGMANLDEKVKTFLEGAL